MGEHAQVVCGHHVLSHKGPDIRGVPGTTHTEESVLNSSLWPSITCHHDLTFLKIHTFTCLVFKKEITETQEEKAICPRLF